MIQNNPRQFDEEGLEENPPIKLTADRVYDIRENFLTKLLPTIIVVGEEIVYIGSSPVFGGNNN